MSNSRPTLFPLGAGHQLQCYEIDRAIGEGGFGITYLGRDTKLNRAVAIKEYFPREWCIRTNDSTVQPRDHEYAEVYAWGLDRFLREAQTLAGFHHPNIVLVHAVFEENDTAYIVMRYEEGNDLEDALRQRIIQGEASLLGLMSPLLDGLQHVHDAGFIHRDIKPTNIFLRENNVPVLLDFGSARRAFGTQTHTLTKLSSGGYSPIELRTQGVSLGEEGPWTDIYGLGATLYRAVQGPRGKPPTPTDVRAKEKAVRPKNRCSLRGSEG